MASLPTPPFSPDRNTHQAHLLSSLITHYQRKRMRVKHTQDMMISVTRQQLHFELSTQSANPTTDNGTDTVPLWQRRKYRRRLHLDDIRRSRLSKRVLTHYEYGNKVLDLFAALLDARIESCRRVESLLIQNAHTTT